MNEKGRILVKLANALMLGLHYDTYSYVASFNACLGGRVHWVGNITLSCQKIDGVTKHI
jgi:adenylosuccinate synthase